MTLRTKSKQGMKHQMGGATHAEPVRFPNWMPCENLGGFHWTVVNGSENFDPVIICRSHWCCTGFHPIGENRPTLVTTIGFSFLTISESENCRVLMKPCKTLFINTP
jgi:hypothetical protein